MPYLWFWLVYGRAPGYPWWDRAYVIALEPWTTIPNQLDRRIESGTQAHLKGGERTHLYLHCDLPSQGGDQVNHIDIHGEIE